MLDTHVWLWWLLEEGDLDESEKAILDVQALNGGTFSSAATIWKAEFLHKLGDLEPLPDFETWIIRAIDDQICKGFYIDEHIVLAQQRFPDNFPDDLADHIIVATA